MASIPRSDALLAIHLFEVAQTGLRTAGAHESLHGVACESR